MFMIVYDQCNWSMYMCVEEVGLACLYKSFSVPEDLKDLNLE